MANNKTKRAREHLLTLLKGQEPLPLEVLYHRSGCDFDTLAGAISSLIEKEEIRIGRKKTKSGWLIGENNGHFPDGSVIWHFERGQMRHTLPKILKELKKFAPADQDLPVDLPEEGQLNTVLELLSDQRPRSKTEIIAETGVEEFHPSLWRHLPQLPDGRYTLTDSAGAWEYLLSYLREKPRRLQDLLRLFRRHKKIIDTLSSESKSESLVRLPRGLITTIDSTEGQNELAWRNQAKLTREKLDNLAFPFFVPADPELDLDPKAFQSLADSYTLAVEFEGQKYRCLRRDFPGEVLVDQLGEISGRYFAPPHTAAAPSFLKEHSLGERETAGALGLDEESLSYLINSGVLGHFYLDGNLRLWRSDVEELKRNSSLLRELKKEHEKLSVPEAAALLGITTSQVRWLLEEGKLNPALAFKTRQGEGYLIRRGEVEKIRDTLPEVLSQVTGQEGRRRKPPSPAEDERHRAKKKPPRKERVPIAGEESFVLDQFQAEANKALQMGRSVLVSAPTGNGKTLVAEMLARDLMASGRGMVYTSPLKALSNQKYRDFKEVFGEEAVGLVTGDISINPAAPLLIMTTEIFRNWCLGEPDQLEKTAYVVFDEIHYLDDAERGTTWEESILFAPPHIKILGLSATVPNVEEMADWIGSVRGEEIITIQESRRHVPLEIRWILPNGRIVPEDEARDEVEDLAEYLKALRNRRRWIEE